MCPVNDGQSVSAAVTNPAFLDAQTDDTANGKIDFANTDGASGPTVTNTQREQNSLNSFTGRTAGSAFNATPVYANNNGFTAGENILARADALSGKFHASTGHMHSGAAGDGPPVPSSSISAVPLRGYFVQAVDITGATGTTSDVSTQMTGFPVSTGSGVQGVVVTTVYNRVVIRQATGVNTGDDYVDGSGNVVYGRITESAGTWTLSYYVDLSGTETAYSFASASNVRWYFQQLFNPIINAPVYSEFAIIPSDNVTADVITATTTQQGKTQLATAAGSAVAATGTAGTANATVANSDHVHAGLHSIAKNGSAQILGDATLTGGTGVTLTQVGNDISIAAGSGSGTGARNYVTNWDAETDTTGWATYADAAANIPVDGTGGTATGLTFSRSTSSPLRDTGSFLLEQANSTSLQGKGVSYDFTIDSADKAKMISVSFDFNATSTFVASDGITAPNNDGTTSTNAGNSDIEVFIYDVTNSSLVYVTPQVITANGANNFSYKGQFQTASNGASYRFILHVATASANATGWNFKFDNVLIGPQSQLLGAPVTDWVSYSPTLTGTTTNPTRGTNTETAYWRRVGDSMEIQYSINQTAAGSAGSGAYRWSIPTGYTIDAAKIDTSGSQSQGVCGSSAGYEGTLFYVGDAFVGSTTTIALQLASNSVTTTQASSTYLAFSNSTLRFSFSVKVPIVGWSSTTLMSNDTDTRVVAARYTKTAAQSTSTGVDTAVSWPTVSFDTHAGMNTTTGEYTVQVAGVYEISAMINFQPNGTGLRLIGFYKGATIIGYGDRKNAVTGGESTYVQGTIMVSAIPGDKISVYSTQTSGGSLNVGDDGANYNHVEIKRLSGPSAIAASEDVNARYTTSAGQSISNSTTTIIDYGTKDYDSHSRVTTGSSWKFTAGSAGRYSVAARATFNSITLLATQGAYLQIFKNGVSVSDNLNQVATGAAVAYNLQITDDVYMIPGDYIDVRIVQQSGGSSSLNTTATRNTIAISRIGN